MEAITTDRIRKSEKLTKEDYSALAKWVDAQPTKLDAALVLGITRPTLDRIMVAKSGRPDTINKIRLAIGCEK